MGWQTVFSDTFMTDALEWTITDTTGGLYSWGTITYVHSAGTVVVEDRGFWATGGGTAARSWPSGTYTNSMTTWAIAGPFTLTQPVEEMWIRFRVQNRVGSGDTLFAGMSGDGTNFSGVTLTETSELWEEVVWTTEAYTSSERVWVGLRFRSDESGVSTGPLIDDLKLAFNLGYRIFLPLVSHEPTPTPMPSPTPLPAYVDHFNDPDSGWYVGPARRHNSWCDVTGRCNSGWEVVAEMSYSEGHYRTFIPLTWHGGGDVDTWFVWPVERAPLPDVYYPLPDRYCVEARGKFITNEEYQPWWAHWGVAFGINEVRDDVYTFQVNANHDFAALRYKYYVYPGNRQPLGGEQVNLEIPIADWLNTDLPELVPTRGYNTVKVAVRGENVSFYVNGQLVHVRRVRDIPRSNVGIVVGTWEVTPVDFLLDYFKYDPNCPEVQ